MLNFSIGPYGGFPQNTRILYLGTPKERSPWFWQAPMKPLYAHTCVQKKVLHLSDMLTSSQQHAFFNVCVHVSPLANPCMGFFKQRLLYVGRMWGDSLEIATYKIWSCGSGSPHRAKPLLVKSFWDTVHRHVRIYIYIYVHYNGARPNFTGMHMCTHAHIFCSVHLVVSIIRGTPI